MRNIMKTPNVICGLLASIALGSQAAVVIESSVGQTNGIASTYSMNVTGVQAGELVAFSFGARCAGNVAGTNAPAAPTVQWVGATTVAMTKAVYGTQSSVTNSSGSFYADSGVYYLSGVTGNGLIQLSYANTNRSSITMVAMRLSGVDTLAPIGTTAVSNALVTTSSYSLSITPAAADSLVIASLSRNSTGGMTNNMTLSGETSLYGNGAVNQQLMVASVFPGSISPYNLSWTADTTSTRHVFTGVEIRGLSKPNLVYLPQTNSLVPGISQDLKLVVSNIGAEGSNVTATLAANVPGFSVVSTNFVPSAIAPGQIFTNLFTVSVASNAIAGLYSNAFSFSLAATGENGTTNFSYAVPVSVAQTVFSSIGKTGFAADNGTTDSTQLTISNTAPFELSYSLSGSTASGGNWLSPVSGSFTLPAGAVTNITVTADGSATPPGSGSYSGSLSVSYSNNGSQPNPAVFPLTFNVGAFIKPLTNNLVIVEGSANGRYEPGETLTITVTSTNQGAVTVNMITNSLTTASGWTVSPSNAVYSSLAVGQTTSTTYTVTIPLTAPDGIETVYLKNAANGQIWPAQFNLTVYNRAVPSLSTNTLTLTVAQGSTASQIVTVTNGGNAPLDFTLSDNAVWSSVYSVSTNVAAATNKLSGGTALTLNDPLGTFYNPEDSGESDTAPIGFSFPFYGVNYTNFYIDSNGAILLSTSNRTSNLSIADGTTGHLPLGSRPMIAPFRTVNLNIPAGTVKYALKTDPQRLVVFHNGVTLPGVYPTPGTNLQFQTELFADGSIKFSYFNINGGQIDQVAAGVQGSSAAYLNTGVLPATGRSVLLTATADRWVTASPAGGTVAPFSSTNVTFTANGISQLVGTTNSFVSTFSFGAFGISNVSVNASVTAPVTNLTCVSNFTFSGNAGVLQSATLWLTNAGTVEVDFQITSTSTVGVAYGGWVLASGGWSDVPTNAIAVTNWIDPSENIYITAEDEGFSLLIPIGFSFPFYEGEYTHLSIGVNGGISLGTTSRISAAEDFSTTRADVPQYFIAPYWGNLSLDANASVKYWNTSNALVVVWQGMEQSGVSPGADLAFEAVLYDTGAIAFCYRNLNGSRWYLTQAGIRSGSRSLSGKLTVPADQVVTTNQFGYAQTNYVNVASDRFVVLGATNRSAITYYPSSGVIPVGGRASIEITGDGTPYTPGGGNSISNNLQLAVKFGSYWFKPSFGSPVLRWTGTNNVAVTFVVTNSVQAIAVAAAAASLDQDGDGASYDAELIAGTDPLDAGSVFSITSQGGRELSWNAVSERTYTVWFTLNLKDDFQRLEGASGLSTNRFVDTQHSGAAVIYYRVTVDF
jgi:uncharacterized membrane protein